MSDIRSYKLAYPAWPDVAMWFELCQACLGKRLAGNADTRPSLLEKRKPVSKTLCVDCVARKAKGR